MAIIFYSAKRLAPFYLVSQHNIELQKINTKNKNKNRSSALNYKSILALVM